MSTPTAPPAQGPSYVSPLEERIEHVHALIARMLEQQSHAGREELYTATQTGNTDASGDLTLSVFKVPSGFTFALHRTIIESAAYTPAVPYSNAAAYLTVNRGQPGPGSLRDFGPASAGGPLIPGLLTDPSRSGAVFQSGEEVVIFLNAGPATTAVAITIQGYLNYGDDAK